MSLPCRDAQGGRQVVNSISRRECRLDRVPGALAGTSIAAPGFLTGIRALPAAEALVTNGGPAFLLTRKLKKIIGDALAKGNHGVTSRAPHRKRRGSGKSVPIRIPPLGVGGLVC